MSGPLDDLLPVKQDIKVNAARPPARFPVPAHHAFYRQQCLQKFTWLKHRPDFDNGIDKPVLLLIPTGSAL